MNFSSYGFWVLNHVRYNTRAETGTAFSICNLMKSWLNSIVNLNFSYNISWRLSLFENVTKASAVKTSVWTENDKKKDTNFRPFAAWIQNCCFPMAELCNIILFFTLFIRWSECHIQFGYFLVFVPENYACFAGFPLLTTKFMSKGEIAIQIWKKTEIVIKWLNPL